MKKLVYISAIGALVLGSCAAPKLAKESVDDDFYGKEYIPEESYASTEEGYTDEEYKYDRGYEDGYSDGYSYSSRLRRFHSPFYGFSYFDYYDPFYYDPWMGSGFGLGLNFGWGGLWSYRPWGYYSYSPYYYSTPYWGYNYASYGGYWGGYHPGYYYSRPIYRPSTDVYNRPRPRVGSMNDGYTSRPRPGSASGSVNRPSSRPRSDARPSSRERPSTQPSRPRASERPRAERPQPREAPRPQARPRPQSRPSYSPPSRSSAPRSSGGGSRSSGSSRPRPR